MLSSKYKWKLNHSEIIEDEKELLNILLKNRNIKEDAEREFLYGEGAFHSPFLFRDMEIAVTRIKDAVSKKERVIIYGDYDVDGVTGTSILYKTLKKLGLDKVDYYIPNRFTEGYGPNLDAFKSFVDANYQLVITVDNGITGVEECQYLIEHDVDVIITDHHEAKEEIPNATAIIHPKLAGETYPFKDLAGCGVSFKLSEALLGYIPIEYSDLAALGTYADIVTAVDENRSILKLGLKQLENTSNLGLRQINQIANVKEINEFTLGFIYGPRLNAPGRMESANESVRLLVSDDVEEVRECAYLIEEMNNERRSTIDEIMKEASKLIEEEHLDNYNVLVIANDDWHEGVLGIVAARLVEAYGKPAIVLSENSGSYKGSARTLADFPLFENLNKVSDLLDKFGGHKMAAGLSLEKDRLKELREALHALASDDMYNILTVDCMIDTNLVTDQVIKKIDQFRPFGPLNRQPLFLFKDFEVVNLKQIGAKGKHLKFSIKKENQFIEAIAFNFGSVYNELMNTDVINVVGHIEVNHYNNKKTYQVNVKDISCEQMQVFDYRNRYFNINLLNDRDVQLIYFNHHHGFEHAEYYKDIKQFKSEILLIDMPSDVNQLISIVKSKSLSKLYVLFKEDELFSIEHLMTREKMIKIYALYRKYKQFDLDDKRLIKEITKLGFNKKIHLMSIKVFFELNFVIIDGKEVKVIDRPEKRDLSESKTFNEMLDTVKMKEILALSSTKELKQFLFNL